MSLTADLAQNTMRLEAELAAANERIRELESWQETVRDYSLLANKLSKLEAQLTAEREVSDKLEKALQTELGVWKYDKEYSVSNYSRLHVDQRIETIHAALAEVVAIRKGEKA